MPEVFRILFVAGPLSGHRGDVLILDENFLFDLYQDRELAVYERDGRSLNYFYNKEASRILNLNYDVNRKRVDSSQHVEWRDDD